jgi:hypothetical protein
MSGDKHVLAITGDPDAHRPSPRCDCAPVAAMDWRDGVLAPTTWVHRSMSEPTPPGMSAPGVGGHPSLSPSGRVSVVTSFSAGHRPDGLPPHPHTEET